MPHGNASSNEEVPFTDYVIAAIDERAGMEQVTIALHSAGFSQGEIVISPANAPGSPALQEDTRATGTLAEEPNGAQSALSEEGVDREDYAAERRRGQFVVEVHATSDEQVERARAILAAHHAHMIKRVGQWTRENLSDRPV